MDGTTLNPNLPPELARLEAQFAHLVDQVERGELTVAQAQPILERLVAFDANNNRWTISPQRKPPHTIFLVSKPGVDPQPADPTTYLRPGTHPSMPSNVQDGPQPRRPQQSGPNPWDEDLLSRPNVTSAHDEGHRSGPVDATPSPGFGERLREGAGRTGQMISRNQLLRRFLANRTVVVAAICLCVLAVFVAVRRDDQPQPTGTGVTCTAPASPPVGMVDTNVTTLFGCLAAVTHPTEEPGPANVILITQQGQVAYAGTATITREQLWYGIGSLHRAHLPAPATTGAPLDDVTEPLRAAVGRAIDAGLVTTQALRPTDVATKADVSAATASLLRQAGFTGDDSAILAAAGIDPPAVDGPADADTYIKVLGAAAARLAGTAPTASTMPSATSVTPVATSPATATPTTVPVTEPAQQLPGAERVEAVFGELTSGDRARTANVIAAPGSTTGIVLNTALWAGFGPAGLTVACGAPAVGQDGIVVCDITVTDTSPAAGSATVYATGVAQWIQADDGAWFIAAWPQLTATS